MKDDYGREWKRKDYLTFLIIIILLIIAICIPAGIYGGLIYVFGLKYQWYFFGIIFGLVFLFNVWITIRKPKSTIHNYRIKNIKTS